MDKLEAAVSIICARITRGDTITGESVIGACRIVEQISDRLYPRYSVQKNGTCDCSKTIDSKGKVVSQQWCSKHYNEMKEG
jgi:hypothetical protein